MPHTSDSGRVSGDAATDLGLLGLALIWGLNFSVIKVVLSELGPLALNALRFPLAALVLWLLVRRRPGPALPHPADRVRLIGLGILGHVIYQLCFIFGIDRTLAGNASLLLSTTPVWTVLLSTALGHERLPSRVVAGVVATFMGMILVVLGRGDALGVGGATLQGDVLMVAAAVLWSAFTVGCRQPIARYGPLRVTAWTLWIGTPALLALGIPDLLHTDLRAISPSAWAGVAYAGVLAIAVAYLLWYRGVQRIGASRTAVYSNLVPVVALVIAWFWLGETPGPVQLLGAGIIFTGIALSRAGMRRSDESGS